ncbi:Crustacean calcium-binding protein 23 [Portunus trituberculatus]|uniref:Crustacean calcium-binding protein 23 n=1 Tax=Portunus trituberculatus TaxID=210409 RepID=A0A5B7GQC9_PORTR|nr:Crustacean calcium-binding protein 23 [Portunus trituberculatus]
MMANAKRKLAQANDPVEKLRLMCLSRGVSGIMGMGKVFRRMDDDGSHNLNMEEFSKGITETGLQLNEEDTKKLFNAFDRDGSGSVNYDEFLVAIRHYVITCHTTLRHTTPRHATNTVQYTPTRHGPHQHTNTRTLTTVEEATHYTPPSSTQPKMNDRRKKLVDMAFDKLDKTDDGVVTLEDLKGVYSVTNHPKYQSGEMTEEDILNTVLKKFENNTSLDGKVIKEGGRKGETLVEKYLLV